MTKMTPEHVARRLRTMSELSKAQRSPMIRGVDMSQAAVAARLRELAEVSELCSVLGTARRRRTP